MPHRNRIFYIFPNNHFRTPITATAHTASIPFGPPLPRTRRPGSLTHNHPILRPVTYIGPLLEQATRPASGPSLHSPHLVIPRPARRVWVCIPPSPGPIPIPVPATTTTEVRVTGSAIVGCEGVHKGAQAEDRACHQGEVEMELGEDRMPDCGESGVFDCCVFFEGGEVEAREYY